MGVVGTLVAAATGFQLSRYTVEEPPYTVVERREPLEVRRYRARVVAQTRIEGDFERAQREGFRRLAGYISGKNESRDRIDMTAPVHQRAGERIPMTTPVEQRDGARGPREMTFTMPAGRDLDSLPEPLDRRVQLRQEPPTTVAVLRFAGRASAETWRARSRELLAKVREQGWVAEGEPSLAQYDPPWVLGPLRRNEVWVPVRRAPPEA